MSEQLADEQVKEATVIKGTLNHPESRVAVPGPAERTETLAATSAVFTRATFEDALDKVSRPLRGRLAHVPYRSEDFIREKREEAELEDRPS